MSIRQKQLNKKNMKDFRLTVINLKTKETATCVYNGYTTHSMREMLEKVASPKFSYHAVEVTNEGFNVYNGDFINIPASDKYLYPELFEEE